ncbi:MAG TPA: MFS transporter [Candidatus Atribacteria bacterium]|nr:MFS transporter [Candidatus Atribacteria bacterium]
MKKQFLLIPFFFALIVIGLGLSGMGVVIPEMAQHFSVSYSVVGRVFLFHGLGHLLSILIAGILGDIIDQVSILRLGIFLSLAGFGGISFLPSFSLVMASFLLMGVGLGFIDAMVNPIATSIFTERSASSLNIIHAFFGLGSLAAPRLYSFLVVEGYGWRNLYQICTLFTLVTLIIFLFPFIPRKNQPSQFKELLGVFKQPVLWLMGFTTLFYAGGVSTLNGWLVSYLEEGGVKRGEGAIFLSYFWLGIMLGRLILSPISDKIGHLNTIRLNALGGIVFISLFLLLPFHSTSVLLLLFGTGFMLSTLIPTTVSYAIATFPEVTSTASSWVLFNNSLGSFLFPWLGGVIGTAFSLRLTMIFVPLFLILMFLFQQWLATIGKRNVMVFNSYQKE